MARQAFGIVGAVVSHQVLVGIVAGDATDARVGTVEALAVGESKGLETHIHFAAPRAAHDRFPATVTLPAKIRDVF